MNNIAILCCSSNSVYKSYDFTDCYDEQRSCYSFNGGMPVVAHPPCRAWSRYMSHYSKHESSEVITGYFCIDAVRKNGGVLEHPAHSRLFDLLPKPGYSDEYGTSIEVWQYWFGYPMRKRTWLYICSRDINKLVIPYRLETGVDNRKIFGSMNCVAKSRTTPEFADFLLGIADGN